MMKDNPFRPLLEIDSAQRFQEREEQMERRDMARAQTAAGTCSKCGILFTSPSQYRYRRADGRTICRDIRGCRRRSGQC